MKKIPLKQVSIETQNTIRTLYTEGHSLEDCSLASGVLVSNCYHICAGNAKVPGSVMRKQGTRSTYAGKTVTVEPVTVEPVVSCLDLTKIDVSLSRWLTTIVASRPVVPVQKSHWLKAIESMSPALRSILFPSNS